MNAKELAIRIWQATVGRTQGVLICLYCGRPLRGCETAKESQSTLKPVAAPAGMAASIWPNGCGPLSCQSRWSHQNAIGGGCWESFEMQVTPICTFKERP